MLRSAASTNTHQKNFDIEVLRAIAILSTLVAHLDILFFWGNVTFHDFQKVFFMWGGVDLFFCISGYVITSNLMRLLSNRTETFREFAIPFWIKRAYRILPSAWLWFMIPLVLSVVFNSSGYMGTPLGNLVDGASILTQVANFHFWTCYAFPGTTCGINQVYWSLSLEEQSYILLPMLLFFANKRTVVPILIAIVVVQMFLHRPILSFLWFVRTDALALGALIAIFQASSLLSKLEPKALSRGWLAIFVLSVLCLTLAAIPGAFVGISFHTGLVALLSAALVLFASFGKNYILPPSSVKNILVYIGSRSYAIYLIHVPVYRVTREIWIRLVGEPAIVQSDYRLQFILTAWTLTIVLAEINYRFIENPIRRYGARVADRWSTRRSIKKMGNAAQTNH